MKSYYIRTFGCQMNKHDSERISGLLEASGYEPACSIESADVIVFNTCCVRETADERLYGQVSSLKALKTGDRPDVIIAVGGCIGQRDGNDLLTRIPHLDVVFGTYNIDELPGLLEVAFNGKQIASVPSSGSSFASDLPAVRTDKWHGWISITVGCNNHCTYCIVPSVRGPERSRPMSAIVLEAERLVADGVVEITLLGQNVNSYGRDLYGEPRFAELLYEVAKTGIQRIRFATSHPKDISRQTIDAFAEIPAVMPFLHLPVQHGSNRILRAMNRGYTREQYLAHITNVRAAVPDIALSTDIIVGFPGETADDFEQTLDIVRTVKFDHAFTFIYSPREGTPAALLTDTVARDVAQERFDRLVSLVRDLAYTSNQQEIGLTHPILIEGPSRRDPQTISARTPHNRLVHTPLPIGADASGLSGQIVNARITAAHPWFLTGEINGTPR